MAEAPAGGTTICPRCGQRGRVRLARGRPCAACLSEDAWSRSERLVITHADIARAERRRGRASSGAWLRSAAWIATGAVMAVLALAAGYHLILLFLAHPLTGLDELLATLTTEATRATLIGGAALVIALVGLLLVRRRRLAHRWALLAAQLAALLAGSLAFLVGGWHWLQLGDPGLRHLTMPPITSAVQGARSLHMARIVEATAVILAPDADGDGRYASLGTAAVIGRHDDRAWLVTCSHVVTPHISVTSPRRPEDARPVWVQLSDGRSLFGRVVWQAPPPLDVAVVEVAIADPPRPVEIALATDDVIAGAPVMFVPNPYRDGWLIHYGAVERRREHATPAGRYSLLYTDLPVQPGDSGSGMFDARGMLVGLNTWSRLDAAEPRGISLPSETLRTIADSVAAGRVSELDRLLGVEEQQQ